MNPMINRKKSLILFILFIGLVSNATAQTTPATRVLVSNDGQTGMAEDHAGASETPVSGILGNDILQQFTTGSNPTGYTLKSITVHFAATDAIVNRPWGRPIRRPERLLCTLLSSTKASLSSTGLFGELLAYFDRPDFVTSTSEQAITVTSRDDDGIKLEPNQSYYFSVNAYANTGATKFSTTTSASEDSDGLSGWNIENSVWIIRRNLETFHTSQHWNNNKSLRMSINGFANPVDAPALVLSEPNLLTMAEGSIKTYTMQLTAEPTDDVTVRIVPRVYSLGNRTNLVAVSINGGQRSTTSIPTFTFTSANWNQPQTITAFASADPDSNDAWGEINHVLSGAPEYSRILRAVAVNIDEDRPSVSFSAPFSSYNEDIDPAEEVTLTVLKTGNAAATVQYKTVDGIATEPGDYTATSGTLNFLATENEKTITIPINNDDAPEGRESFHVILENPSDGTDLGFNQLTVIDITSSDNPSTVSIAPPENSAITEGDTAVFSITSSLPPLPEGTEVTVIVEQEGAFANPADLGTKTITLDVNGMGTVEVRTMDDGTSENQGWIDLHIQPADGYSLELPARGRIVVNDNDIGLSLIPRLVRADGSITVSRGGVDVYWMRLNKAPTADVIMTITGTSASNVTVDTDASTSGNQETLTFTSTNWDQPQEVRVMMSRSAPDGSSISIRSFTTPVDRAAGVYTLTHTASGAAEYVGVTQDLMVRSVNPVTFSMASPGFVSSVGNVDEGVGELTFTVTKRGEGIASVDYEVPLTSGSATGNVDYVPVSGTLNFGFDDFAKTFKVSITDDLITESGEDFTVLLKNPIGARMDLGQQRSSRITFTVSINASEQPGLVFTPQNLEMAEDDSKTYTVKLGGAPANDVTLTITGQASTDLTVDTDSSNDGDQNTLVFTTSNWNDPQTVTIRSESDVDTDDDSINLLHTPTGSAEYVALTDGLTLAVTIVEDFPEIQFGSDIYEVNENEGSITFLVKRGGGAGRSVTVDYEIIDVTATSGSDYLVDPATTLIRDTLTFQPNDFEEEITIDIHDDNIPESDESFKVVLSSISGGNLEELSESTGVIIDDEVAMTLSPDSITLIEGQEATYTVALNIQPVSTVRVTIDGISDTEVSVDTDASVIGNQNTLTFNRANWISRKR